MEKTSPLPTGGHAVYVQGLSELVRYHQAIFLTPLDAVQPLRAEDTRLVTDASPEYRQTALYVETLLRRTPPTHDKIAIGHRGALDVMPYQLVPAHESLSRLRPRMLIADGTGLGKTVEIGITLTELIKRGRGRRILVVAIRSMLAQLQRELWARFTLPLVRLDAEGIQRVQGKIPSNRNPFSYFDRVIVSMDTLKNHGLYRAWLEQIRWDVIVVDECHNVANKGSQRADLARLLASRCDALVLTSATPHNGRPESFANLMRMLDPTSIADPTSFTKEEVQHLFVRRFKKDVENEARGQLREREVQTHEVRATPQEDAALAALHGLTLHTLGRKQGRRDALVRWTLIKAFLSSPDACLESLDNRIAATRQALAHPEGHPRVGELEGDLARLVEIHALVTAVQERGFGKLDRLIEELRKIGVGGAKGSPRAVIFSERITTLDTLRAALIERLGMKPEAVGVFTARDTDEKEQRALIESFGHAESPLRVLLCSDAASEGVNLHHQCHHLFHFDVPWSLIRLTQRNGRIDRFGQRHTPNLRYLVTRTESRTADQHVVDRLIEKEREVERQLGDPGALLGLYDADREDEFVTRGLARGKTAEELVPEAPRAAQAATSALDALSAESDGDAAPATEAPPAIDLFALLAAVQSEQAKTPSIDNLVAETPSLFENDYELLVAALRHLENHSVVGPEPLKWTAEPEGRSVVVHAPEPFRRHREGFLPREGIPSKGEPYRLVMGRELVMTKLRAALDDEGRWPDWHLLWEQHPLVEWIFDALASAYARGEAPLLRVPALGAGNALFMLQGSMFNHESEAVVARWMGLTVHGETIATETLELAQVMERVRLGSGLVNSGRDSDRKKSLQSLVPKIVQEATARLVRDRQEHVKSELGKRARNETRRVERWAEESRARLDRAANPWTSRGAKLPKHIDDRLRRERDDVERALANHREMLRSLQAAGAPHVRVVAVFSGE
ncbi:MAG: DEAD/DEAH box helicase [Myxococcota bacterium]|nr:DEAD/DEAH box helicase [Myxococcota bacterium]